MPIYINYDIQYDKPSPQKYNFSIFGEEFTGSFLQIFISIRMLPYTEYFPPPPCQVGSFYKLPNPQWIHAQPQSRKT